MDGNEQFNVEDEEGVSERFRWVGIVRSRQVFHVNLLPVRTIELRFILGRAKLPIVILSLMSSISEFK